jgi:hypothetical protein
MKRVFMIVTVIALSLAATGLLLAQNNSLLGTWKFNEAKSKYVNLPAPKSATRTVEEQSDGVKVSVEGISSDGSRIAYSFTTNFDGKISTFSGVGVPNGADSIEEKRIDANTVTARVIKAGKMVQTNRGVVSKDGKVLTITAKGTNAKGESISYVSVWDKQ